MTGRLTAAAEWKALPGDSGELEGHASVFNVIDQGGDVVLPGAFKKTLADWSRARQPLPLIADHQLSTDGVIGSVTHAQEDGYGLKIRAVFSGIQKAQDIRTKMIEGHLRGMSFTYDAIRHYRGEKDGRQVRFLQELKLYEATVTPFPMNQFALASAKGYPDDDADGALAQLAELEQWAAAVTARDDLDYLLGNPESMAHLAGVMLEAKAQSQLAELEAWAAAQPPIRHDPQAEAEALRQARWQKNNDYSNGLLAAARRRSCGTCWRCQAGGICGVYL